MHHVVRGQALESVWSDASKIAYIIVSFKLAQSLKAGLNTGSNAGTQTGSNTGSKAA